MNMRASPPAVATKVEIKADDGYLLSGIYFEDHTSSSKAIAAIIPAVGVPKEFYIEFASWLAGQRINTLIFDYRGVRENLNTKALRKLNPKLSDWGKLDVTAAIKWLRSDKPKLPLHLVAHSIGGHMMGLTTEWQEIDSVVTVTSGSGYWRHWPLPKSLPMFWFWYLLMPVSVTLFGYLPGIRLGWSMNMSKAVAMQWGSWARHPDYMLDEQGRSYAAQGGIPNFDRPIYSLSFTDDNVMSKEAVEALHGLYTNSTVIRNHIAPESVGLDQIGHFGFFRPQASSIWPLVIEGFHSREQKQSY